MSPVKAVKNVPIVSKANAVPLESDEVLKQLRRVRGQLDGVIRMYDDERACVDIVRQVIAARNSLGRVARELLTGEATRCTRERRIEDLDAILEEVFRY